MKVLKFGGTSVSGSKNFGVVATIIKDASKSDSLIVVSSAIAGCTDKLLNIAKAASERNISYKMMLDSIAEDHFKIIDEIVPFEFRTEPTNICNRYLNELSGVCEGIYLVGELTHSSSNLVAGYGELLSTTILSAKLSSISVNNIWADSRELIKTLKHNSQNIVDTKESYNRIEKFISSGRSRVVVVPGFIASDHNGKTTTLGRGGSDYTASIFAAAVNARILEIWSDVSGMMTADPRVVEDAKTIEHISYKEALELSHFGAKVIYPPTIQPAIASGIPIVVKNTFNPNGPSTIIERNPPGSRGKVRGISGSNKVALLSLEGSGMVGIPGYSSRFFTALAKSNTNIILITQASSLHTMCVAIDERNLTNAAKSVDEEFAYEISLEKVNPVIAERGFAIISLVGDDMKNQSGTSGKMFEALGQSGVNIRAIAQGSSEKNISVIVSSSEFDKATKAVHKSFFGNGSKRRLNIFIAGFGNIGKALIKIIDNEKRKPNKNKYEIVIVGVSNSKGFIINKDDLDYNSIESSVANGLLLDNSLFLKHISNGEYENAVFVDCTADAKIISLYPELINRGVHIVTCNKIAPSSEIGCWNELQELSSSLGVSLLYETTAGAALPIISTIKRIKECGDQVIGVEAILSGTLNYIFSSYNLTQSFEMLVKKAKELGYTEPDPKIDLSGADVVKKCVIIARECGFNLEQQDVVCESADFSEEDISKRYIDSASKGCTLRYIASVDREGAKVLLKEIPKEHPFANICETDNSVRIITKNYPNGITISGAGAGNTVTAGGVLNDILACVK